MERWAAKINHASSTFVLWLLVPIIIVAAVIRFDSITQQSIWLDEAISIRQSSGSLSGLITQVAADNYPPLHNLLLWIIAHVFGTGELAMRAPSAVLGVAQVAMTYYLGRVLGYRTAGLIAALFVALSAFAIWYSQEARMYSLLAFSSTSTLALAVDFMRRPSNLRGVLLCLAGVATAYSHFYGLFDLFGILLAVTAARLIWPAAWKAPLWLFWLIMLLIGVTFLPWLLITVQRAEDVAAQGFWIPYPNLDQLARQGTMLLSGEVGALIVGVGLLLLITAWPKSRPTADMEFPLAAACLILAVAAITPILIGIGLSMTIRPILIARYVIGSLSPLLLLAALGYARFATGWRTIVWIIVGLATVCALGPMSYAGMGQRDGWRDVAAYLKNKRHGDDCLIVFIGSSVTPLEYYYGPIKGCLLAPISPTDFNLADVSTRQATLILATTFGMEKSIMEELASAGFVVGDWRSFNNVDVVSLTKVMAASHLEIDLRGEDYKGPPAFEIVADGQAVGRGTVSATAATAANHFEFQVPKAATQLVIKLTNDLFVARGKDRNLIVAGIAIDGVRLDLSKVDISGVTYLSRIGDGSIVIATNEEPLIIKRPAGGWAK
jgi:hypothetical protein